MGADRRPALGSLRRGLPTSIAVDRCRRRRSTATDDMVSWRAGAVYKPRPNGSIYLGYGTSFNPSAEGLALSAATVDARARRRRATFEVGTKWDVMQERLSLTPARSSAPRRPTRARPASIPAIRRRCWRASRWSTASSSARRAASPQLDGVRRLRLHAAATSPHRTRRPKLDNALALTPEHTLSLWTTYDLPRRRHGRRRRAVHGQRVPQRDQHRAGAELLAGRTRWSSYDVNEHLTLRLNGNNLADEEYVDRVGGGHYIPGAGPVGACSPRDVRF